MAVIAVVITTKMVNGSQPRDHLRLGQSSDGQQHQSTMHLGFPEFRV